MEPLKLRKKVTLCHVMRSQIEVTFLYKNLFVVGAHFGGLDVHAIGIYTTLNRTGFEYTCHVVTANGISKYVFESDRMHSMSQPDAKLPMSLEEYLNRLIMYGWADIDNTVDQESFEWTYNRALNNTIPGFAHYHITQSVKD